MNLSKLKYFFLDIKVAWNIESIFISQRKYVLYIITETWLLGSKPVYTSIELNNKLYITEGQLFYRPEAYRWLVGRFILQQIQFFMSAQNMLNRIAIWFAM